MFIPLELEVRILSRCGLCWTGMISAGFSVEVRFSLWSNCASLRSLSLYFTRRVKQVDMNVVRVGAEWCTMKDMADTDSTVRQSVSIPARIARRVRALAKRQKTSANRVLVELIESGLESKEAEKERFLALANRLTETADPQERQRLKKELARMTFGE